MTNINLSDGHLDELLSAELDGELTPEESVVVAKHIELCEKCRLEREELWKVKTSVQQLGPVEPPFGFEQRLLKAGRAAKPQHRWSSQRVFASVVATAAVWVAVLAFGANLHSSDNVEPPVSDVRAFVGGAGLPSISGSSGKKVSPDSRLPDTLNDQDLESTYQVDEGLLATYGTGKGAVTVFFKAGDVDWSSLSGGKRSSVGGLPGQPWQSDDGKTSALVFQDQDAAVMLVGDVDKKELVSAAKQVPGYDAPAPSVGDRLKDAGNSFIGVFGLGS